MDELALFDHSASCDDHVRLLFDNDNDKVRVVAGSHCIEERSVRCRRKRWCIREC